MPSIPPPVFPDIPASDPSVTPPTPGEKYDQWYLTGCSINRRDGAVIDLESFWVKGNATGISTITTNNVVRNITSMESMAAQLGGEWLDANPDVVSIMPQFLAVLAKVAGRQGVL